ncbi:hypothetical protein NQ315_001241 [Exocentrus adspersus]|uniref:MD-2-related lipid-recognition domain-containing protein n=1 Tax=Exocentrus adspersus TaxID=1586481 RepID=A0AAV8WG52_9CUCU|nr:hypothetical protein NQ315_001241 [Exocentrus adspersus]
MKVLVATVPVSLFLVLVAAVGFVAAEGTTSVRSCNGAPTPEVQMLTNNTLCPQSPCVVRPGTDLVLHMRFKSPRYLEKIKLQVIAKALGVTLDYPLFQDDACVGISNTYCPIVKHETVEYSYTMHLLDIFPEASVNLAFSLIDLDHKSDENADVLCFEIDIQLKKDYQ